MNKVLSLKTFFFSSFTILLLGLVFLGGFYFIVNGDQINKPILKGYLPVTTKPTSFILEITNPDDELLVFDKSQVISGKTSPRATVIISSGESNMGLQADIKGEFSKVFVLSKGLNEISIAAFNSSGNSKVVSRTIYYSEEKI